MVQLLDNGGFAAALAHNVSRSGTYSKTVDGGRTIITFNTNGAEVIGWIENNELHIPAEWDDGCGHRRILPLR
jgi:hypothetical protein